MKKKNGNLPMKQETLVGTCSVIPSLKNAFGDCVSEPKKSQPSQLQILKAG